MSAARTRWGFHQLRDGYARSIVATADVSPDELVIDLGAGTGAITAPLIAAGARVIAVELHPRRAERLRALADAGACRVVQRDLADFRFPVRPFRVVANPPFALLATLLRHMTASRTGLVSADLVAPAYFAKRCAHADGPVGRRFSAHIVRRLPMQAFVPAGTQPIAVLRIERR